MAYTLTQLEAFFKNANAGTAATAAQITGLQGIANQNATGVLTDAQALQSTISLAANVTTEVSVQTYQFFTGTAPSEAGLAALNAAYVGSGAQSGLNGENRYIAQSVSLALQNATAKANFAATYGSLSIADATKAAYNVIVGNTAAAAAGINVDNAVAFLSSAASVAYYTAFVRANAGLGANPSAADVDLAVKAALVGSIIYNATVFNNGAGVGSYATATNNLIRDLADDGKLTQNNAAGINLFTAYPVGAGAGSTIALATTIDTLSGTSGNDTFQAVLNSSDITKNTLNPADNLTGGDGVDTLQISASGAAAAAVSGVTLNSIENIAVTNGAAGVVTFDGSLSTGVTGVSVIGSTGGVTFNNLKAIPTISLVGNAGDVTVGLAAAATVGLADTAAVTLNSSYTTNSGTLTVNGIESLTVNTTGATGSATTSLTIADDSLQSLAVTGAGGASLVANLIGATGTITGVVTSAEGADTVAVTAGSSGKLSVNMGAGNDTVSLSTVAATYTVAGGEGTDTLVYTGTTAVAAAATANVTGFEAVRLTNAASFNLATSSVTYTGAAGGTYTGLTAATAGATVNAEAGGTVTLAAGTAAEYTGSADAVTVNVGKATTAGALSATVSTSGIETVTVNNLSLGTDVTSARTITVSDAKMKTLAVSGGAQPTTVSGGGAALTSVNTTGVIGNVTFNGTVAAAGAAITAGAGNDNLTGGAGVDTIIGGAGNDTISGGTGADVLTGGDGADVFVIAANTALVTNSTAAAPKVINDFVSGTDKLQLAQGPVSFLGNFANIQQALAAAQAGGVANQAAYVTGENNLYVFTNTNNTLNVLDTVVKLTGVSTLAAGDLQLGTQGATGGAAITLNNAAAVVGTTGALVNAAANAGTTVVNTTVFDDAISATGAQLVGSTLTGGAGVDSITITGTAGSTLSAANLQNITGFETLTVNNATAAVSITLDDANVAAGTVFTVNAGGNAGVDTNGALLATAVTVDATAETNGRVSITGGAGNDALTGGNGNDTINGGAGIDTIVGNGGNDVINAGDGNDVIQGNAGDNVINGDAGDDAITSASATDTVDGGAGNDTVTVAAATYTGTLAGGAGTLDTLKVAGTTSFSGATVSGFERLDFNSGNHALTMTVAQHAGLAALNIGGGSTQQITFTTTGAITGMSEDAADDMTYVLANGAGNVFTAATTATDYKVTGGDTATTYNFGATLTAADTITGTAGSDILNITGAATGSANITLIETINVTSAAAITVTTGAIAGTATGTINLAASTGNITLDATAFVPGATSVTIIDGAGNDSISIPNTDANRAKTIVTLSTGGADTITIANTFDGTTANAVTINNFTQAIGANQDKIAGLGITSYATVTSTGNVAAANSLIELETGAGVVSTFDAANGGTVELAIDTALGTYGGADGSSFYTVLYGTGANAGKAALYQVQVTTAGTGITAANIAVELVGIFNGVTNDAFVTSNFI